MVPIPSFHTKPGPLGGESVSQGSWLKKIHLESFQQTEKKNSFWAGFDRIPRDRRGFFEACEGFRTGLWPLLRGGGGWRRRR